MLNPFAQTTSIGELFLHYYASPRYSENTSVVHPAKNSGLLMDVGYETQQYV